MGNFFRLCCPLRDYIIQITIDCVSEKEDTMRRRLLKGAGALLLSMSMALTGGILPQGGKAAGRKGVPETKTGEIVINGDDIKKDSVNGLTYKGFGLLSGNSSSDLLMDYKAENPEAYAELMQRLFGGKYPIMTHVKLEMGNDRNTSTGPESATKRYQEQRANVKRNPGWQLAADAKKVNPNVKVSILSWCTPAYVSTDELKYAWYKESILAGYETYGFMVDYINPNVNESWNTSKDVARTKKFAKWIKEETSKTIPDKKALELYQKIQMVVSDEANVVSDDVAKTMKSDQEFYDAVGAVGYHYKTADDSNGGMKWLAEEMDKEVWNSEGQATFSNSAFRPANNVKDPETPGTGIGGVGSALEMGNAVIKFFTDSRRSHVIYQPAIGGFYEGGQYSFKELVSARDPWSGWIHYDAGLLVLSHLSKFAVTGWESANNTAGIWRAIPQASKSSAIQTNSSNEVNGRNGGENYMTVASPAKDNFSTMVVNDSEYPMTYTLKTENMNLTDNAKLELWETRAADQGAFNENYMKCLGDLEKNGQGEYAFQVKPYSVVTVTSLDVSGSQEHTEALPVEGDRTVLDTDSTGNQQNAEDGYLYADDFNYEGKTVPVLDGKGGYTGETENYIDNRGGETGAIPRYNHNLNGAFEVYRRNAKNFVLRQQLNRQQYGLGGAWGYGDAVTAIGDYRWTNYAASVDVYFEKTVEKQYASIGIRQFGTSPKLPNSSGYSLQVMETGDWKLYRLKEEVASGKIDAGKTKAGTWFQLKLRGAGNKIQAYINNELISEYEDASPITAGRVALGCDYTFTQFDNLAVTKVKGYAPYYTEAVDNLEMYDLTPQRNAKLAYNDQWNHTNGQGMFVYQRSSSWSTGVGASMTYRFKGTGMEIIGANKSANKVNVTVDGNLVKQGDPLQDATDLLTAYRIDGLEYGDHTVTIQVAEGSLHVDLVGILGQTYQGEEVNVAPKADAEFNPPKELLVEPPKTEEPPKADNPPKDETPSGTSPKKGYTVKVGNGTYKVTSGAKKTVAYAAAVKTKATGITVPGTVMLKVNGKSVTCKVTSISAKAFAKCKKLKKVTIGKNIASIGKEAFKGCKALKKIAVKSKALKSVGKNAIKGIHKKAVISCGSKAKAYKKLFSGKTGYKKSMKVKK